MTMNLKNDSIKKENRSRRAKLNLVTKTHWALRTQGLEEEEAIKKMAKACHCTTHTVREWLPEAKASRRPPQDEAFDLLKRLHDSFNFEEFGSGVSVMRKSSAANTRKAPLRRQEDGEVPHDGAWRIVFGELKRRQGRPRKEDALFKCVAEKLPFSAIGEVRRNVWQSGIGQNGIYVAHDSMGVARYIGRGNIFNRLKALHRKHANELLYFSFYVVQEKNHEREIETLLIRAAGPQLHFNDRKKRVDIQAGRVSDFEAGTFFFERKARRGRKPGI